VPTAGRTFLAMLGRGAEPASADRHPISRTRLWRIRSRGPLFAALLLLVVLGARERLSNSPGPHISALMPGSAMAGRDDLLVSVAGEHFQPGASVVLWNGSARPTQTFQGSTTLLAATIYRSDLRTPGPATVTVTTVDSDTRRSSPPVTFDVVRAAVTDVPPCRAAAVFGSDRPGESTCLGAV
jgi:hypothetical protein